MQNIKENNEYIVIEFVSAFGNKYEVGYPKASGYTKENMEREIANAKMKLNENTSNDAANYTTIDWILNHDSKTSRASIDLGIVGGEVTSAINAGIYKYQVNFANNRGWNFLFKDDSTDTYSCLTLRNGNHYINYNSPSPSMIGVM